MLRTGIEVHSHVSAITLVALAMRILRVTERGCDIHVDTPQRIDAVLESLKVDPGKVIDMDTEQFFQNRIGVLRTSDQTVTAGVAGLHPVFKCLVDAPRMSLPVGSSEIHIPVARNADL